VEEKVQPQKPPKPRRINREAQKDPEAPMDLRACGTGSKTPGGIPASSKAKLTVLLKKEGFTVSSSTVGRILKSLKTRGLLRERNQKPTGESETPSHEKTERLRGGISRDLVAIDTSGVVPFLRRVYREFLRKTLSCGGPLPPSIPGPRPISPECSSRNSERYPLSSASHSGRWRE